MTYLVNFLKILFSRLPPDFGNFENAWEVKKNQNAKIISNGAKDAQNDERIPNLGSEFKWDNI